ncbi:MAG: (2Fe-2S) ferredoxin domain-containing protein [Holophagaceae bacterium]|jgi:NADH:ubiquinone oxidoreductase subunit E|nr:(2Fe-2S) ferredoxin domain-containing protein [Holophagaceae bacterium]
MAVPTNEIVVCMGSACFSRGNTATILAVQDYVSTRGLEESVLITGTLCQHKCRQGPNIEINGECLCGIDPATLPTLLDKYFGH